MATIAVTSSENISGNVGSCSVVSKQFSINSWHDRTVATNSCTGEIVSDTTFFQFGYIYAPLAIVLVFLILGFFFKFLLD